MKKIKKILGYVIFVGLDWQFWSHLSFFRRVITHSLEP